MKKHIARAHPHIIRHARHFPVFGAFLLGAALVFALTLAYADRMQQSQRVVEIPLSAPHSTDAQMLSLLSTQTLAVPDQDVVVHLVNGMAEFSVAPGSAARGVIMLLEGAIVYHDPVLHNDFVVAPFAVSGGGSGTFNYAVLFERESSGALLPIATVALGDRVEVQSISYSRVSSDQDPELDVTIMTRPENEAMGAPRTVQKVLHFYFQNGAFVPRVVEGMPSLHAGEEGTVRM